MTEPSDSLAALEEQVLAAARRNFDSFFRWVAFLDDRIKSDIGPKFGVDLSLKASAVEQTAMGLLFVTRPLKEPLPIPFAIEGTTIRFGHPKFERDDEATGEKTGRYDVSAVGDVNRILGDVVQDYIG